MDLTIQDKLCNAPPLFHCLDKYLVLHFSLSRAPPKSFPTSYQLSVYSPLIFFSSPVVLGNLASSAHGVCIVYPSEIFDPEAIVDAVVEERRTALHGVPTHFLGVLSELEKRKGGANLDFSSLIGVVESENKRELTMEILTLRPL
jgi:acyl-CoA synthetase (AMP-forming)/AMP-acid ligase II